MGFYLGRPNVIPFFTFQIAAYYILPDTTQALLFQILLFLIITCYGGGFASIPAHIEDLFGTKHLGAIHGYILTAWAAAGLVVPNVATWIRETTDSYALTLYIFGGLVVAAFIISLLVRIDIKQLKRAAKRHSGELTIYLLANTLFLVKKYRKTSYV
ncbi:MFS transporter, OFA family, oxalate/formate antiporter [Alteribacillus bidgolensis]|uniref:MFS transporter, OFA family, oxalate/formate antiporter n=1 Tax=Alteribacillus bidgolensis TaxID=930129 RepID=A0A1G8CI48_9BACI|nr:MFS transporter, OFA family, oxalate/formate antiporter [Alteribacillus bidgolensis]